MNKHASVHSIVSWVGYGTMYMSHAGKKLPMSKESNNGTTFLCEKQIPIVGPSEAVSICNWMNLSQDTVGTSHCQLLNCSSRATLCDRLSCTACFIQAVENLFPKCYFQNCCNLSTLLAEGSYECPRKLCDCLYVWSSIHADHC